MVDDWKKQNNNGGKCFQKKKAELPPEALPEMLPENYVDIAEKNMRTLFKGATDISKEISTTKIRNLFGVIAGCYQAENRRWEEAITPESMTALMNLRVRMVYEYGREYKTANFIRRTKLLEYLAGIQERREMFLRFFRYMEALIAYHRYLGGKEVT